MASIDGVNVAELIERGREGPWLEYKRSAPWGELALQITKAALAFANTRDGGHIVIGMRDLGNDQYEAEGMNHEHLATYSLDTVQAQINRYADPAVALDCAAREHDGKSFYVIAVAEFDAVPIICTRDAEDELRRAAIYTRSLHALATDGGKRANRQAR